MPYAFTEQGIYMLMTVLLDRDLATLYGVETRAINQAVKRNLERFPERNCFQLTKDELPISLKSQIVILNTSGNRRGYNGITEIAAQTIQNTPL